MPSSPPDDKLIEDGVQDFFRRVHSDLPLRHFGEFHDPGKLKNVVEIQKKNVFRKLFDKIWTRDKEEIAALLMKLDRRMDIEVVTEWLKKNREHEIRSVSLLQKWVDLLCENFNDALEYQLLLNPAMETESLKNYISSKMVTVTNVFESIWKPGTSQMHEERKSKLEKHLKAKEEEMLEKQKHNLESKSFDEGKKLLGEVGAVLLERSRQLKCYVVKHQGRVSSDVLKGMVEEIREYLLNGKGSALKESHPDVHSKLMETLEGEVNFLNEGLRSREEMTAEDVIGFAKGFDEKLRSFCYDGEEGTHEMQEDSNECNPGEQSQRWITIQAILNGFEEEPLDSNDLEENEPDISTHESERTSNATGADGGLEQATIEMKTCTREKRMRPGSSRRRRLKRPVNHTDSDDPTCITLAPNAPPSKMLKTGGDVASKIRRRAEGDVQRRSKRLNKSTTSNSISVERTLPKRGNPRTDTSTTKERQRDALADEGDPHPNCLDPKEGDSLISTDALEPPPNLGRNRGSEGNEDSLEGSHSQQNAKSSRQAVSKTTRRANARNGRPRLSSERPRLRSMQSKRYKVYLPGKPGGSANPKSIVILKGDDPKYFCNVCKKTFKCRNYLRFHGESCGDSKLLHSCDECGKGFYTQRDLDKHTFIHTGEKPFECPKCQMRFAEKRNLTRHIRCHVNEKMFICKPCNVSFVSAKGLHEHNLICHDEGKFRFSCSYCDQRFLWMYRLKMHVITHGDERPFKCPMCGYSFSRRDILVQHCETTHSLSKEMANKLVYDASVAYLLEETKNESIRDIPADKVAAAVVDHVIKKENLRLPNVS